MDTRAAFDAIRKTLDADPQKSVIESFYDDQVFGNFCITYIEGSERVSVVNDRGQLIRYQGEAADEAEVLLENIRSADESQVIASIC
jgi:hypothetical protein